MSVLIKGLDMPEKEYIDVRIFKDGTATIATGEKPYYRELKVVEVPTPHGGLIDSEEFKNILTLGAMTAQMLGSDENTCSDIQFMKEILGEIPTVIEAEGL